MTSEDLTRQNIDRQLDEYGWKVQNFSSMNIKAGLGVAIRGYQLATGEVDYGLYIDTILTKITVQEANK